MLIFPAAMKDRFKLFTCSDYESDPDTEPVVAVSPGSLGEADLSLGASAGASVVDAQPHESTIQPSLELSSAPSSPRSTTSSALERNVLQTFNGLEALHNLPRLQQAQLPLDLYNGS